MSSFLGFRGFLARLRGLLEDLEGIMVLRHVLQESYYKFVVIESLINRYID